jgi:hypothetical protein
LCPRLKAGLFVILPAFIATIKGGIAAALVRISIRIASLTEMPPAVLAAEPGAGSADKVVAPGPIVAADRAKTQGEALSISVVQSRLRCEVPPARHLKQREIHRAGAAEPVRKC